MALTPVPTIDPALPVPPNPADDEAVFDAKAYAWSEALPGFGSDVKAIGDATYANAQWAQTKAGEAATQVGLAAAQVSIAAGHASNASTSANNAADSATAASESATEAEGLVEKYQGALASDPALDKTGGPLTDGDWYVSTVTGLIRAYTVAGGWVNGVAAVAGVTSFNGQTGAVAGVSSFNGQTGEIDFIAFDSGDTLSTVRTLAAPDWLLCNGLSYLRAAYPNISSYLPSSVSFSYSAVARTLPSSANWRSVTYGNGVFVAVADGPSTVAATSPDGVTWTARTLPSSANWYSVTYGNGVFVAVAYSSDKAATSPDGVTWTVRALPSSANWYSVTYGNGVFVAVAYSSDIAATSPDGVTWTARTLPSSANWYSVTYGNGVFVAVADGPSTAAVTISAPVTDPATFVVPSLPLTPTKTYIKT